jgi:hypothetical protein
MGSSLKTGPRLQNRHIRLRWSSGWVPEPLALAGACLSPLKAAAPD